MEEAMLKELVSALAISVASVLALPIATAHEAPAMKPAIAAPESAAQPVQMRRGSGGMSRGMSRGMGRSFGGSRGMGRSFGGMSRGPRVGGFSRGPGRSVYRGRGGPKFSGRHAGRRHHGRHHKHRRFRGYAYYGLPYVYAYSAYDDYSCAYLRRRAIRTGSSYWWRRYEACRYGYEY
jgi:hypothetical protein